MKRAAICIGVGIVDGMQPLRAAVSAASKFEEWALSQGCETKLLMDTDKAVEQGAVFRAVKDFVDKQIFDQLIIYFSGHGILVAPGTEYWLLSGAPTNAGAAVNVTDSVVGARNSGVPHIVLISDACRSSASGPPLNGMRGSPIFPNQPFRPQQGEVDIYYATRAGDPAWEAEADEASKGWIAIFTDALLDVVNAPPSGLVESIEPSGTRIRVISSRQLKGYLEKTIPENASAIDIRIRQAPQVVVESALPKYFAQVDPATIVTFRGPAPVPPPTLDRALSLLEVSSAATEDSASMTQMDRSLLEVTGFAGEAESLRGILGATLSKRKTGFMVHGCGDLGVTAKGWRIKQHVDAGTWIVTLESTRTKSSTAFIAFGGSTGTVLPILSGFTGHLIVADNRLTSVNYVPSEGTLRHQSYTDKKKELVDLTIHSVIAARNGRFVVRDEPASKFAERIRQGKGIDPTLGIYAAYAYAQGGSFDDVVSVYRHMTEDAEVPVPFDIAMLAALYDPSISDERSEIVPFCPLLGQGWAFLGSNHSLHQDRHEELRAHLIPALWTTFDEDGLRLASDMHEGGAA